MARLLALLGILALLCWSALADVSCAGVNTELAPCLSYLIDNSRDPSSPCCKGVVGLNAMANTKENKQAICKCLKSQAAKITGLDVGRAADLPAKCGVKINIPISPDTDCTKISGW